MLLMLIPFHVLRTCWTNIGLILSMIVLINVCFVNRIHRLYLFLILILILTFISSMSTKLNYKRSCPFLSWLQKISCIINLTNKVCLKSWRKEKIPKLIIKMCVPISIKIFFLITTVYPKVTVCYTHKLLHR